MAQVTIADVDLYTGEIKDSIKIPVSVGDGEAYTVNIGQIRNKVDEDIPTKVSQLTNDAGYLTEHQDISGKADKADTYTKNDIDGKIEAIDQAIGEKAAEADLQAHTGNTTIHITAAERTTWNGKTTMAEVEAKDYSTNTALNNGLALKADKSDTYTKSEIDSKESTLNTAIDTKASQSDFQAHTGDTTIHITAQERTNWNGKTTMAEVEAKGYAVASDMTTELNKKADKSDTYTKAEIDTKEEALNTSIGTKANASDLSNHTGNTTIHITAQERTDWNAKADATSVYTKSEIDTKESTLNASIDTKANQSDFQAHTSDTTIHITADERSTWNGKTTMAEVEAKDYATNTALTEGLALKANTADMTVETWTFEIDDGTTITRNVYVQA